MTSIIPRTPLQAAAEAGDAARVSALLAAGADPNANEYGRTALMEAAENGHADVVRVLLAAGADPNVADGEGWTALMEATAQSHAEVARLLLAAGADPNAATNCGKIHYFRSQFPPWMPCPTILVSPLMTALMLAADLGNADVARLLLDAGANPNAVDAEGKTALTRAAENGHEDVARPLRRQRRSGLAVLLRRCRRKLAPKRRGY